jgi:hypothetical protein
MKKLTCMKTREAWTIKTVSVAVVDAAAADDDNYDYDYGEKEIIQFKTYYFSSTCIFATDIHLSKVHCLKNKVPHSNKIYSWCTTNVVSIRFSNCCMYMIVSHKYADIQQKSQKVIKSKHSHGTTCRTSIHIRM